MKFKISALLLSGLTGLTPAHAVRPLSDMLTHEVKIQTIQFSNSSWSDEAISENVKQAQAVLNQCGVKLEVQNKIQHDNQEIEVYFDLEGYTEDDEAQNEYGTLSYGAKYAAPDQVRVFFFERFDAEYAGVVSTAVPEIRVKRAEQSSVLNSIWMSYRSDEARTLPPEEGGARDGYNVLAHELGHILLNDEHTKDTWIHNLMNEQLLNLNGRLTGAQCERIRNSPFVHPLSAPNQSRSCVNISSNLSRNIFFENVALTSESEKCQQVGEILTELERVQEAVSDLQPVFGIDFYFFNMPSEIQYMDRHAFDSSLNVTYDPQGLISLGIEQQKVLWSHELGHAILNEQLKVDWPWYANRLKIMQKWGDAVAESTELEGRLDSILDLDENMKARLRIQSLNEIINKHIEQLRILNHAAEFEAILAPYHEFFADAIAVIYADDGQIIKKALVNPNDPDGKDLTLEEREFLEDRDYSYLRDVSTWERSEAHSLLTPSLSVWWQKIENQNTSVKITKKEHIRNLYRSLLSEIMERTAHQELWELSPSEINARLIRKL